MGTPQTLLSTGVRHVAAASSRLGVSLPAAATLAVLLAVALPLIGSPAAAAAPVAGSEYAVTFNGTARVQVSEEWGKGEHDELSGSWAIADATFHAWLPATAGPEEETGTGDETDEFGFSGGQWEGVPRSEEPATLTETGYSDKTKFTCTSDTTEDSIGNYLDYVGTRLGTMRVRTTYLGRAFELAVTSSGESSWSCDPAGGGGPRPVGEYPPSSAFQFTPPAGSTASYSADGGHISYGAAVPFADVGEQSFTLPVTDDSTVNQAPWWSEWEQLEAEWYASGEEDEGSPLTFKSHQFSVEGSYEFQKVCDGTIVFNEGIAEGSCGAAAPPAGTPGAPPAQKKPIPAGGHRCVVPRLKGKKLAKARKLLAAHRCKLGKVRKRRAKRPHRGKVLSQSKPPGRKLAAGAKVGVVVGKG